MQEYYICYDLKIILCIFWESSTLLLAKVLFFFYNRPPIIVNFAYLIYIAFWCVYGCHMQASLPLQNSLIFLFSPSLNYIADIIARTIPFLPITYFLHFFCILRITYTWSLSFFPIYNSYITSSSLPSIIRYLINKHSYNENKHTFWLCQNRYARATE